MGFLSVCSAVYDYQPQSREELEINEGELLYIIEKDGADGWWKARKKAAGEDDEEPEGLIPFNYVEDAKPTHRARALYDYTRQTDEEVSFSEGANIDVYDLSDPDWTLVGINGEYGFAPANYIEVSGDDQEPEPEPEQDITPTPISPPRTNPAAALANVTAAPVAPIATREVRQPTPEASDEEQAPQLPRRPPSQSVSSPAAPQVTYSDPEPAGVISSPPHNRVAQSDDAFRSPGGFHLYNISEMVSVMGRRKKMPTTLGLNIATGTIMLSPEKTRDGPTQEWTADKLSHYSIEGKHVFLELVRPSKSLDLHAGAKDTAQEIVSSLGEIAGAHKAEGFKEIVAVATSGSGGVVKKGVVLYDFMAQGEDEVTVAIGDDIIILDDVKSEEWWNIRRLKNGSEGVMPSSYIEITSISTDRAPLSAGRSTIEQNRLEEQRLTKESSKKVELPARGSSLGDERPRKEKRSKSEKAEKSRSRPDPNKTRTWTDHSGSFKVEAQFVGIADGKIHLHKVNGVKIAVPVTKMSPEDLDYVEKVTNESIEDHIPVADLIKLKRKNGGTNGASVESNKPKSDYDWFDFFLVAGVGPHQCERYAQAMVKDSMDESVLPDITTDTLRNIGLKEGDALKVMKHLDQKFGRSKTNGDAQGAIFSGPGGALHNNTRRGRPDANRQANDVVNADAFEQKEEPEKSVTTKPATNGFDDDAWEVKSAQPRQQAPQPTVKPASENMAALSLLDKPLEPTPAQPNPAPVPAPIPASIQTQAAPQPQQPQQTGATPGFFSQVTPQVNAPRQRPQAPQQFTGGLLSPPPRPTSAPQNPTGQFIQPLQPQHTGLPQSARPAPPGQSLDELTASRMQQQYLQSQPTGYQYYSNGMVPQQTGFQYQQPYLNGNANASPFADPRPFQPQPTGFLQPGPAPGSLNSVLPPALQPQRTGYQNGFQPTGFQPQPTGYQQFQPQQTGFQPQPTSFQNGFGTQLPPIPPMPQHTPAPLIPQKTGPAPSVKFGVAPAANKLTPQPTGRANLANATPQNPFGF